MSEGVSEGVREGGREGGREGEREGGREKRESCTFCRLPQLSQGCLYLPRAVPSYDGP